MVPYNGLPAVQALKPLEYRDAPMESSLQWILSAALDSFKPTEINTAPCPNITPTRIGREKKMEVFELVLKRADFPPNTCFAVGLRLHLKTHHLFLGHSSQI